ncbi:MAG: hypothetical protein HN846_03335 [Candidatus Pacebacteria bacterium]|nr:hypothetical protein [Candidatus Paceibacterota bacterium]MBT3512150.1 hypothetical protein [Candidatus Paceibacterota bacterium]MBT4005388.1 hypothetical protein [Candidatus Paceibacterota bacterium]MBT4359097.1 hypothetical protein [Candidatus Paceibacterota bacterium]MBT6899049.1 hypothetical protein [Candidatus Paceibacterota bacterium]
MKKKNLLLGLLLGLSLSFLFPKQSHAADLCSSVSMSGFEPPYGGAFEEGFEVVPPSLQVSFSGLQPNTSYEVVCVKDGIFDNEVEASKKTISVNATGGANWTVDNNSCWEKDGGYKIKITNTTHGQSCIAKTYAVAKEDEGVACVESSVSLVSSDTAIDGTDGCFAPGDSLSWNFRVIQVDGEPYQGTLMVRATNVVGGGIGSQRIFSANSSGAVSGTDTVLTGDNTTKYVGSPITYSVYVDKPTSMSSSTASHEIPSCRVTTNQIKDHCTEDERINGSSDIQPFDLCKQIPDPDAQAKCEECKGQEGIWTAIGCIDTSSTEGIVSKLMTTGISIAGGIALLMILASAFLFATSEGEPKRTSEAKEILTSAIIGLIFIIFSVTILQFIGVNILHIPGFGEI